MKKTVLAIMLVLSMMLSLVVFTSCGSPLDGDDPIAAMKYIDEQMKAVKGFDVTMTMKTMGEKVNADVKIDISGEAPKMYMSTEMMGMNVKATLVDGTMYMLMSASGMTMKQKTTDKTTIDEMMGDMNTVTDSYDYTSAEFVSRENGVYVIKATVSADDAKDLIGDMGDLEITDITATVTYECNKDGKVSKSTIAYSYKLAGETVDSEMVLVFNSLEIPTITAPSDADEYVAMEE